MFVFLVIALAFFPSLTYADGIQELLGSLIDLINDVVIPLIFGLATIFFLWNAVRFFIIKGNSTEGQDNAKKLMIYGFTGMVLMLVFFGLVRLLVVGFGINRTDFVCPDYLNSSECDSSGRGNEWF